MNESSSSRMMASLPPAVIREALEYPVLEINSDADLI